MKNVSDRSLEKLETHILYSMNFFSKFRPCMRCEKILYGPGVGLGETDVQMAIWCMRMSLKAQLHVSAFYIGHYQAVRLTDIKYGTYAQ
jgi:hypothetical protein